jgi:hypothetical protein
MRDPQGWQVETANQKLARAKPGSLGKSERLVIPWRMGNAIGGKGPHFQRSVQNNNDRRLVMNLKTPEKVEKLQRALRTKAKESPSFRFYALYDKLYRDDILLWAYLRCRDNGGSPGVDNQSFEDIEAYGLDRWLGELADDLKQQTYRPEAVRRVWIPKPDGKKRPLGIPTIRDRVAQMAFVLVVEPIFDEDLQPEPHA